MAWVIRVGLVKGNGSYVGKVYEPSGSFWFGATWDKAIRFASEEMAAAAIARRNKAQTDGGYSTAPEFRPVRLIPKRRHVSDAGPSVADRLDAIAHALAVMMADRDNQHEAGPTVAERLRVLSREVGRLRAECDTMAATLTAAQKRATECEERARACDSTALLEQIAAERKAHAAEVVRLQHEAKDQYLRRESAERAEAALRHDIAKLGKPRTMWLGDNGNMYCRGSNGDRIVTVRIEGE